MGFTLRFLLGSAFVFALCSSYGAASPWHRTKRQDNSSTSDEVAVADFESVRLNKTTDKEQEVGRKGKNEIWNTNRVTGGDKKESSGDNRGEKYKEEEEEYDEKATEFNPKKYFSSDFPYESDRFTVNAEKYTSRGYEFDKYRSPYEDEDYTHGYDPTPEFAESKHEDYMNFESSLPDFTKTTEKDFPETKERYLTTSDKFMDMENKNGTDKKIDIDYVTIKKIERNNDKKNGNSIRKNVVTEKRTSIVTSFTKTTLLDDKDDEEEEPEESHKDEEDYKINRTTTEKPQHFSETTRKNIILTKPPSLVSNISHISLLNNKIEAEVLKSVETTSLPVTKRIETTTYSTTITPKRTKLIPINSKTEDSTNLQSVIEEFTTKSSVIKQRNIENTTPDVADDFPVTQRNIAKTTPNAITEEEKPFSKLKTFPTESLETTSTTMGLNKATILSEESTWKPSTVTKKVFTTQIPKLVQISTLKILPKVSTTTEAVPVTTFQSIETNVTQKLSQKESVDTLATKANPISVSKRGSSKVINLTTEQPRYRSTYVSRRVSDTTRKSIPDVSNQTSESVDALVQENKNIFNIHILPHHTETEEATTEIIDESTTTTQVVTEETTATTPEMSPVTEPEEINTTDSITVEKETVTESLDTVESSTEGYNTTRHNPSVFTTAANHTEYVNGSFVQEVTQNMVTVTTTTENVEKSLTSTTYESSTTSVTYPSVSVTSSTEEPLDYDESEEEDEEKKIHHVEDTTTESMVAPATDASVPVVTKAKNEALVPLTKASEEIEETTVFPTESSTNLEIQGPEDGGGNNGMIAAITISCVAGVCLVILAVLLVLMRKRQKRVNNCRKTMDSYSMDNISVYNSVRRKALRNSKRSFGNPVFEDPSSASHPLTFPALAKFSTNSEDIKAEFEDIPQITARMNELPEGCDVKNRYANVIPLPETRVMLNAIDGMPNSDYINANYVTGARSVRGYYIACQAPMQNTVEDFWRMIWEQESKLILMLTHLFENGVEKCIDYLPPSEVTDCHRLFGDFQITLKHRDVKEKYIISSLQLKNMVTNSWRELTHFWYLGWPEKGVPNEANSLIAFLIEARSYMKAPSQENNNKANGGTKNTEMKPVVVHCSPGTGRTGTVIACDIAIREFEVTREVDIPKIVYKIRRDRASSVQTKEQYAFIYKVISLYAAKLTGGALDSL